MKIQFSGTTMLALLGFLILEGGVIARASSILGVQGEEGIAQFSGSGCGGSAKPTGSKAGFSTPRANRSESGVLSLFYHDRLYRFDGLESSHSKLIESAPAPVFPEGEIIPFRTKARESTWYAQSRDRQSVLEWDSKRHRWMPYLTLEGRPFHDFEIGRDGQVIIITPAGGSGSNHMVEVYDPHARAAHASFEFPDLSFTEEESVRYQNLWTFPITAVNGDMLALYLPMLGRLFVIDLLRRSLREVPLPWKGFDRERLNEEYKANGLVNVSHPAVGCIQFIPEGSGDFLVAYKRTNQAKVRKTIVNGRVDLVRVGESGTNEPLATRHLTSSNGGLSPEEVHPMLSLPIWVDAKGQVRGIEDALTSHAPRGR